jgi:hypothetical protein
VFRLQTGFFTDQYGRHLVLLAKVDDRPRVHIGLGHEGMEFGLGAIRHGCGDLTRNQQPGAVIFRHGFSLDEQTSRDYETADEAVNVDSMNQLIERDSSPVRRDVPCGSLPATCASGKP